jgi:membrane protein implicated in regulation of membrane protease activity
MTQSDRLFFAVNAGPGARRPSGGLLGPVMWLAGVVATVVAMAVGAVLAIFTAAAVAVIALFAAVLVFFAGLALRARRSMTRRDRRAGDDVIEARKVDGAWVAYGWERPGR